MEINTTFFKIGPFLKPDIHYMNWEEFEKNGVCRAIKKRSNWNKTWYQKMSSSTLYKIFAWLLPFGDQTDISFRWRYLGGRPYTEQAYYPDLRTWAIDETVSLNSNRHPPYHRFDFRLDRRFMFKGWNMVTYIDIMNVYGRDNIWMYEYNGDGTREKILQFQVFPVGGVTIEF